MTNNTFNVLDFRTPQNEDFLVDRIIEVSGSEINEEGREELKALIRSLPEGATMATLVKEVMLSALQRMKPGQEIYPLDEFHNAQRFSMKIDVNDEN